MKEFPGRLALLATFFLGVELPAAAQLSVPSPKPILGARMPSLSPDGERMAFVYQGDVWIVPSKGGTARPLTLHVEMDAFPLFSPDGQWIAFGTKRNGNWDVYLVPAAGGPVRQLTCHAADEIPQGWSPDGSRILFAARLDSPDWGLFAIDVKTLHPQKLAEDYASINFPNYSPDGRKVVFGRGGFHWSRPRYVGSAAAQIWMLDVEHGKCSALTSDDRQHLWTRFMPDGTHLLTVTIGEPTPSVSKMDESIPAIVNQPLRTPNLWLFTLDGKGQQRTFFTGGSVRCPSVAAKSADIAFEYEHDLWLLANGQESPRRIEIYASADEKQNTRRREKLTYGVTEAEPSPDGKTFAFGLRGDIWTVSIDRPKGVAGRSAEFARRMTEWEGDDSDFVWSADGKKLFFTSDRVFNTRLYEMNVEDLGLRCLWDRSEDVSHPLLSPDGRQLSFWVAGREGGLFVMSLADSTSRRVAKAPGMHWFGMGGGEVEWSPDSKWLAYSCRGENQAWNIYIVSVAEGKPVNVTNLNANHDHFGWSPEGQYLFFQSNRDGDGLYILPLMRELARSADADFKFERPKGEVHVQIEFEGISKRIRKLASVNPQADLTVTAQGAVVFLAEGDVWSVSYDGKDIKRLTADGGKRSLRVAKDGETAYFVRGGELWTLKLSERNSVEKIVFAADWEQNVQAERLAAFTQFWRSYHRGFYDPNFHGRDWNAIRHRYEPLLEAVETREEFATLLQMMVGELDASHSEVTPSAGGPASPVTPHLGFEMDYSYPGPGLKISSVPPGSPGSYRQTSLAAGEYVLAINGRDVSMDEQLFRWINDKQERDFEFLVNTRPVKEGARLVHYRVLTQDQWRELMYRNQLDRHREYVERQTAGRIGYLHLPSMGQSNQAQFEREAFEYVIGKDAMVIDVRFNSGGYVADTLIDWLERKPRGYLRPRDGAVQPSPARAWDKPMVVLINEHSFSNAEIFAYAMRARGLAKLVGMPTPGYVIWTDGLSLVDGTGARMPMSASYRLDGSSEENCGEKPDYQIQLSPEDWASDRDPQLDRAIELLKGTYIVPPLPAAPATVVANKTSRETQSR